MNSLNFGGYVQIVQKNYGVLLGMSDMNHTNFIWAIFFSS